MRRALRRVRLRLWCRGRDAPTLAPAQLRTDPILATVPDAHLQALAGAAQLRHLFERETVCFQFQEEEEAYVVVDGALEVVAQGKVVAALGAGAIVGTIGMVSGEPRTANVVAACPTIVWVLHRRALGPLPPQTMERLLGIRQGNMLRVYAPMLTPAFLRRFRALHGASDDTLRALLSDSALSIVPAKKQLATSVRVGGMGRNTSAIVVLRGTVTVDVLDAASLSDAKKALLREIDVAVSALGDITKTPRLPLVPVPAAAVSVVADAAKLPQPPSSRRPNTARTAKCAQPTSAWRLTIPHPVLLNLCSLLLPSSAAKVVVTSDSPCDVLRIPRALLFDQDVLELDDMRQAILAAAASAIEVPGAAAWCAAVFGDARFDGLRADLQRHMHFETFSVRRVILQPGVALEHDSGAATPLVLLVLTGEVESTALAQQARGPHLWPNVATVYYASQRVLGRTVGEVEALELCAADVQEAIDDLPLPQRPCVIDGLKSLYHDLFNSLPRSRVGAGRRTLAALSAELNDEGDDSVPCPDRLSSSLSTLLSTESAGPPSEPQDSVDDGEYNFMMVDGALRSDLNQSLSFAENSASASARDPAAPQSAGVSIVLSPTLSRRESDAGRLGSPPHTPRTPATVFGKLRECLAQSQLEDADAHGLSLRSISSRSILARERGAGQPLSPAPHSPTNSLTPSTPPRRSQSARRCMAGSALSISSPLKAPSRGAFERSK
jgi:CRP-like cAMP-binding protein